MHGIGLASGVLTTGFNNVLWLLFLALLLLKLFALVDAAMRREDAYRAADKKTKTFWVVILALVFGFDVFAGGLLNFLSIIGDVGMAVYLLDVRPALKQVSGRRGGGRQGPYGPW